MSQPEILTADDLSGLGAGDGSRNLLFQMFNDSGNADRVIVAAGEDLPASFTAT